tara:strand:- start:2234 stop:2515 length:282 start_codon:yes stop_codon:yes gene_type:complete
LKHTNKQYRSKKKEFVCSTNVFRKPGKLYYINKEGNLIETVMGHRNPNHKGTLVGELNIVREKGYLYFCYDSENFENKIDIYRVKVGNSEKIR